MRPLEIPDFSTPLRPPPGRFHIWTQGRRERGAEVVAAHPLPGGRLAFAVADELGRRTPRPGRGIATHLVTLLALGASPATALAVANVELRLGAEIASPVRLVSLFAGIVDRVSDTLLYASAGRETGLLLSPNGTYRFLSCGAMRGVEAELAFRRETTLAVVSHPSTVRPLLRALRGGEDPGHALVADAARNAGGGAGDAAALVVRYA